MGGTKCPKCKQYAGLTRKGLLAEHHTDVYEYGQKPGGRRRQKCGYGGVTPDEARAGITTLTKLVDAYRAAQAVQPVAVPD